MKIVILIVIGLACIYLVRSIRRKKKRMSKSPAGRWLRPTGWWLNKRF